jgi:putative NADPH-quinone reductase
MTKILVIHAHPAPDSFGSALAGAYAEGARAAGHEVRELKLRDLDFDPILRDPGNKDRPVEPDLLEARADIEWAEHVVLEYPTWWAAAPALLKGFFDRAFSSDWAYRYRENSSGWDKLLAGRSARLLVTMDAPRFFDTLGYYASSRRAISKGVFWFCGFKPVRTTCFAQVRKSTPAKREKWLQQARDLGTGAR